MLSKLLGVIEGQMLVAEVNPGIGHVRRSSAGNLFRDLGQIINPEENLPFRRRSLSGILEDTTNISDVV